MQVERAGRDRSPPLASSRPRGLRKTTLRESSRHAPPSAHHPKAAPPSRPPAATRVLHPWCRAIARRSPCSDSPADKDVAQGDVAPPAPRESVEGGHGTL